MRKFLGLLALLASYSTFAAEDTNSLAPEFTLPTLEGEPFQLADTRGKVVYLDFWASWCGPCKVSFPDMVKLHDEFSDRGVTIIAVSVDKDPAKAAKFLRRYPANFTVLSDPEGQVATLYDLPAMPTTYLLDRDGRIKHVHEGYRPGDYDNLRNMLMELID